MIQVDKTEGWYTYYAENKYPELYLDWVNNFLTVERFAEYYGVKHNNNCKICKGLECL